ncbi:MAG: GntR family transcriptional regulator [Planctomycetota bacterium]|nr:GntR family transcriptional regulator [Planctomycetota bacterium]
MPRSVGRPPVLAERIAGAISERYAAPRPIGARLPAECAMARELGVSRGTIRAAIRLLERRGDVLRLPHRGVVSTGGWARRRIAFGGARIVLLNAKLHYQYPLADPFWMRVLYGVHDYFYPLRHDIVLSFLDLNVMRTLGERLESHMATGDVRGVLLLGRQPEPVYEVARRIKAAAVSVDFDARQSGVNSVTFDNARGGAHLARKMLALGLRRVAAVLEDPAKPAERRDQAWDVRWAGFREAWMRGGGEEPATVHVAERGNIFGQTAPRLAEILKADRERRLQGLVLPIASGPEEWAGLIAGCGRKVGSDFSVFGHGAMEDGRGMSGMRYDARALGREASRLLMRLVITRKRSRKEIPPVLETIPGRYLAGETHAPARDRDG